MLEAEVELRRAVARSGSPTSSSRGKDTLFIYSFMFPRWSADTRPDPAAGETARLPLAETPCPSCTSILDSLDGAAPHFAQRQDDLQSILGSLLTVGVARGYDAGEGAPYRGICTHAE